MKLIAFSMPKPHSVPIKSASLGCKKKIPQKFQYNHVPKAVSWFSGSKSEIVANQNLKKGFSDTEKEETLHT